MSDQNTKNSDSQGYDDMTTAGRDEEERLRRRNVKARRPRNYINKSRERGSRLLFI